MKVSELRQMIREEIENLVNEAVEEEFAEQKLGTGARFTKLKKKLKGKVSDPAAVAASIGRKKYGKERFQKMAAAGKKKSQ